MMGSLYAGVSGLKNHQTKMNVIGNNIANVNTIGFKAGRTTFQEALVQTIKGAGRPSAVSGGTNPVQIGLGMTVATVDNIFEQGGLELTGQITDLAIQGSGFFVLSDGSGKYYSRAGSFSFDANSQLVDPSSGLYVQGRMADADGNIPASATVGNITLPFGQQDPARETTTINLGNNINVTATESRASLTNAGLTGIDAVQGYSVDGAGGTHVLTITGAQATQSTFTGANVADDGTGNPGRLLDGSETLASMGVTDITTIPFTLAVDNGPAQEVVGLTLDSTINDLINAINQIEGVRAELDGGNVKLSRTKAGSGGSYNVVTSASALTVDGAGVATAGNIVGVVFGIADGATQAVNTGTASTLACSDVFTDTAGTVFPAEPLQFVYNEEDGLAYEITGLGEGGVSVENTAGPINAGTCTIDTVETTHAMSITVYDSQGGDHTVTINFIKLATPNQWRWEANFAGNEIAQSGYTGTVVFNSDGSLQSFDFTGTGDALVFDPNNGAEVMELAIDAGTIGGFDGLTGFSSSHTASILQQNGYGLGILDSIEIDKVGNINGIFTNGISRVLAQIVLADFNNHSGLLKAGNSLYTTSANSGEAIEGIAGETISGEISSGALESSSVDIAEEFTSMITSQRGFQANARVITTSDEMLDELVNLKR
ncbi:MAG: flagellar hook-basal body complex protein [candidate division Zixibacteria bacterium]|nr:flagellar hook-basal body complex protein [candidate division Zixibacteria bacterium]